MKRTGPGILLSLILTLTIISVSTVLTLACRPLYYLDIRALHIPETTGYTEQEIRENYNALIDYNLSVRDETLSLPTLPMSDSGRIHFGEVKAIFQRFQFMTVAGAILSIIGILWMRRRQSYGYLKLTAVLSVMIPAGVGAAVALNWDWAFVTFHQIAFDNDYWLFDPDTDPVIRILPDAYFLHCAILLLVLVMLGSVICSLAWRRVRKRK